MSNICALTRTGSTGSEEIQSSEVHSVFIDSHFPTSLRNSIKKKLFSTCINFPLTAASRLPLRTKRWEAEEELRCNGSIEILKHRAGTRKKTLQLVNKGNSVDPKPENILPAKCKQGTTQDEFLFLFLFKFTITDQFGHFDSDTERFWGEIIFL